MSITNEKEERILDASQEFSKHLQSLHVLS